MGLLVTIKFTQAPDLRHPACQHDQTQGCYRCCTWCNHDAHRCGGCGDSLEHQGHVALGTCADCHKLYFTDPEETP